MQKGARYQAVLELVGEIFKDSKPADGIIDDYFKSRKYIGSKDRRFISETVWHIIRNRMKLEFEAQSKEYRKILLACLKSRGEDINAVFDSGQYSPAALSVEEKEWLKTDNEDAYPPFVEAETPEWLYKKILDIRLLKSLNEPARADFRINVRSRDAVIDKLKAEGFSVYPTPYSPLGIRCDERIPLGNCIAYKEGEIEVQDEASQLAAILVDVKPEHKIIDYCCGAGGKSLAMGYLLQNKGHIYAHDIEKKRLMAIKPRLERLGVKNIELLDFVATSDKGFDRFVVDAPCSGTGTWRRSPDAKFRLNQNMVDKLNKIQFELLGKAYEKTKAGGRIVYITCSILNEENEEIIAAFLQSNPNVRLINIKELWEQKIEAPYPYHSEKYLRLSPLTTGTDGFFIAILEKLI